MPGSARMGSTLTKGFDGQMMMARRVHGAQGRPTRRPARAAVFGTGKGMKSRTAGWHCRWTKYSWKSSHPSTVRTRVRTGSSAHRHHPDRDAQSLSQVSGYSRLRVDPCAVARSARRAGRGPGHRAETSSRRPGPCSACMNVQVSSRRPQPLTGSARPARAYITESRSGADVEAEMPKVIAGVDDHGQISLGASAIAKPWASLAPPTPPHRATTWPVIEIRSSPDGRPNEGGRGLVRELAMARPAHQDHRACFARLSHE
jgi:hypothetical protein